MRCREVHALESAYLDGELDDGRASAFRGHMRVCDACRERVADLALVIDTASTLEPVDPPPDLWSAIERELAAAEIADAERSWLWLRWQALRPRLLPLTVGVAAAAAMALWLAREVREPAPFRQVAVASEGARGDGDGAPGAAQAASRHAVPTFFEARAAEVRAADERYLATIDELRLIVDEERRTWPEELDSAYQARIIELDAAARRHEQALGLSQGTSPRERDALHAVYRAQIELMQRAAVDGLVLAEASTGAGGAL